MTNDFILSNIRTKKIHGEDLVFQYINFRQKEITILGKLSKHTPNYVEYISCRPKELKPKLGDAFYVTSVEEFFTDLRTIFFFLNEQLQINDKSFSDAAEDICNKHIINAGRLIDNDLYAYIDLCLIAKNTISTLFENHTISNTEAESAWIEMNSRLFTKFKNEIFLTRYDIKDMSQPKPYLVKYSDMKF